MKNANTIANALLDLARRDGAALTPMQLLKLVYLCHGWMLALYGRPLICQPIEAWRYGPVIADLYHDVKKYRGGPVQESLPSPKHDLDPKEKDIVEQVYRIYGSRSGIELSQLTHARGTPWHTIWNRHGRNSVIPNDLIEYHYDELYESADSDSHEES